MRGELTGTNRGGVLAALNIVSLVNNTTVLVSVIRRVIGNFRLAKSMQIFERIFQICVNENFTLWIVWRARSNSGRC